MIWACLAVTGPGHLEYTWVKCESPNFYLIHTLEMWQNLKTAVHKWMPTNLNEMKQHGQEEWVKKVRGRKSRAVKVIAGKGGEAAEQT